LDPGGGGIALSRGLNWPLPSTILGVILGV